MSQNRLIQSVAATSDANGLATFNLGPAELGYVWQGTLQIPVAPAGALFTARILGSFWGQWAGPTNFGPIQAWGGETIRVTAVGLTPLTQFAMTFTGVFLSEDSAIPIPPAAPISTVSVETATVVVNAKVTTGTQSFTFQPPTLTRRLTLIVSYPTIGSNTIIATIQGNTTGFVYYTSPGLTGNAAVFRDYVAIEPALDAIYTLTVTPSVGAQVVTTWVLASFTNPLVKQQYDAPVEVVSPPTLVNGISNSFFSPINVAGPVGPFKKTVEATFTAGNNQALVAAPGSTLTHYLQTLYISAAGLGAGNIAEIVLHTNTGTILAVMAVSGNADLHSSMTFPGGLEVGDNLALQINMTNVVGVNAVSVGLTYATGQVI